MLMSEFFAKALNLAKQAADEDEVPVGAVVVKKGVIIGRGYNRREQDADPFGHAEMMAMSEASRYLKNWRLMDCELYVTLEPCLMCLSAAYQARIKKIYYGAKDLKGGAISLGYKIHEDGRLNHRFETEYVRVDASEQILKQFFLKKRKEKKNVPET